ncbi:MAG: hypothetical protein KIT59_10065 [Nitrosomonas sp.]|nr:hypothetical protein [Nitrosomonas sp.]
MKKNLISSIFLTAILSWSVQALSDEHTEAAESSETSTVEAAASESTNTLPSGQGWRVVRIVEMGNSGKFVHMVLVDHTKEMDRSVYGAAMHQICGKATDFCRIRFWTQERFIPEKVSPSAEQLKMQKAEYLFNNAAGIRQLTWSCAVNPDKSQCVNY